VLGLFGSLFLLVYGLSAFQMGHSFLFRWSTPIETTETLTLPAGLGGPRAVAKYLMDAHDLAGDLEGIETSSGAVTLTLRRPGTEHVVRYAPPGGPATVTTERADVIGFVNRLHHVTGTWHDARSINAWTLLLGLVSLGLFGVGLTGVAMWFQRKKDRGVGYVLLALSVGGGGGLAVLIRYL
jgi:hypothetical protein